MCTDFKIVFYNVILESKMFADYFNAVKISLFKVFC